MPEIKGPHDTRVFTHAGPASYAVLVAGTPCTGGDAVRAIEAGLKYFKTVIPCGQSDDGLYVILAVPAGIGPQRTFILQWFSVATGLEVVAATPLNGSTVRLFAVGF